MHTSQGVMDTLWSEKRGGIGEEESLTPSSELSEQSLNTQHSVKARADKADSIRKACNLKDKEALASYATTEGGLLDDGLRQKAWPILLQCETGTALQSLNNLPRHADEDQVQLDVNRSFVYYPHAPKDELSKKKKQLLDIITQVLRNHPVLSYFQGYHDIVQVILLVLGDQMAASAVSKISLFHIRDYMLPSLSPTVKHLELIPAIIESTDPALRQHLSNIQPFFALAATLTLYAHDIQEYSDIARLFDYFIAREPVVTIYLFAAFILSRRDELMEIPVDEPEMLHFTLSKLPHPLDLDGHILKAEQLFKDHPPESLPFKAWRRIPWCSVLKTSRDLFTDYSVGEALKLFEQQVRQLRNEERRKQAVEFAWKHRRSVTSVVLAILIGTASFYIQRKGFDAAIWSSIGRLQVAWRGYRNY